MHIVDANNLCHFSIGRSSDYFSMLHPHSISSRQALLLVLLDRSVCVVNFNMPVSCSQYAIQIDPKSYAKHLTHSLPRSRNIMQDAYCVTNLHSIVFKMGHLQSFSNTSIYALMLFDMRIAISLPKGKTLLNHHFLTNARIGHRLGLISRSPH